MASLVTSNEVILENKVKKCLRQSEGGPLFWILNFSEKYLHFMRTSRGKSMASHVVDLLVDETGVPGENHRPAASH